MYKIEVEDVQNEQSLVTRSRNTRLYRGPEEGIYIPVFESGQQQNKDGSWKKIDLWERWKKIDGEMVILGSYHPDALPDSQMIAL